MPGQQLPRAFEQVVDPIVTLAYVAGVTKRIRPWDKCFDHAILLADCTGKAACDPGSRLGWPIYVGLSVGWSRDEFEAVGVPFERRGKRADEFLECLKAIWTHEIVEFRGEFYRVPRSKVEPKPLQKPHPPNTIGGYSAPTVKRAVAHADGFWTMVPSKQDPGSFAEAA